MTSVAFVKAPADGLCLLTEPVGQLLGAVRSILPPQGEGLGQLQMYHLLVLGQPLEENAGALIEVIASGKLKVDTHKAGECLLFSYLLK